MADSGETAKPQASSDNPSPKHTADDVQTETGGGAAPGAAPGAPSAADAESLASADNPASSDKASQGSAGEAKIGGAGGGESGLEDSNNATGPSQPREVNASAEAPAVTKETDTVTAPLEAQSEPKERVASEPVPDAPQAGGGGGGGGAAPGAASTSAAATAVTATADAAEKAVSFNNNILMAS